MYVQPSEGPFSSGTVLPMNGALSEESQPFEAGMPAMPSDSIARFGAPWAGDGASTVPYGMFGPLMGMLSQLMQMLQSLMGSPGCSNERFFRNANGSSDGDPHLSFNGNRWTSMASQPNLLNSSSIPGGFQISTQTTPPNGKGVTWNRSATVTLNGGTTTIALNAHGEPSITSGGQTLSIAPGQTLQLGNGESVVANPNGSLCVTACDARGGSIATTLTARGSGVDVDVNAHDVELGGALVNGGAGAQPGAFWEQPSPFN